MQRIHRLFGDPNGLQALRRASRCLQLTGGVEALFASKARGEEPPILGLANGAFHALVEARLSRLLGALSSDPNLDLGPATGGPLSCAVDLMLRLNALQTRPLLVVHLCRLDPNNLFAGVLGISARASGRPGSRRVHNKSPHASGRSWPARQCCTWPRPRSPSP